MATTKNLTIDVGATFDWGFNYVQSQVENGVVVPGDPYDLTGCTARMQIRAKITDTVWLLSLTTENGGITIDGPSGRIDILITDLQTASLYPPDKPGKELSGVYDLELIWPAIGSNRPKVTRLLEGTITADPGVTRDNDSDGDDDE